MKMLTKLMCAVALAFPVLAQAQPIAAPGTEGFKIIVGSTSNVVATYLGTTASYSNDLYLFSDDGNNANDLFLFNNHGSAVGATVDLGSFAVGTELVFRLHVNNTGDDFFSGPAERNPDDAAHARVQSNWGVDTTLVSFEDLLGGAYDFNDLSFSFTNTVGSEPGTTVPEPGSLLLLGLGLAGVFAARRRK